MRKERADGLFAVHAMVSDFSERLSKAEPLPSLSEVLVELLNGDTLTVYSKPRVRRILYLLKFQRGYESQFLARSSPCEEVAADLYFTALLECNSELNERLLGYKVTPQIHAVGTGPPLFFLPGESSNHTAEEKAEVGAVMSALLLAQQGHIDNVRECSCGTLFVAGRIDQQHCSTKCRVKAHQSSDEFKTKRREADRERYRLHRDGKVKEANRRNNGTHKTR